jgi:hypothetical protein
MSKVYKIVFYKKEKKENLKCFWCDALPVEYVIVGHICVTRLPNGDIDIGGELVEDSNFGYCSIESMKLAEQANKYIVVNEKNMVKKYNYYLNKILLEG